MHTTLRMAGLAIATIACGLAATPALAGPPGAGEEVYGATVDAHEWELEARYGTLVGGADAGTDNTRFEVGYGVSDHLRLAVVGEFEREAGDTRRATHMGIEAVANVARIHGLDVAVYGEFEKGLNGDPNGLEAKLLVERRTQHWDLRANLITEKPLDSREALEFAYAASADVSVTDQVRVGVQGFGDLGTTHRLFPLADHYLGPSVRFSVPHVGSGLLITTGYLLPLGSAKEAAKGQFKLNLELEL